MDELKRKVFEARDHFHKLNNEAFEACRAYNHLQAKINELRDEYLGLCEVLKPNNSKPYVHLTGLIMLKQRMQDAYRKVRLESLRTLKRSIELLKESDRAYREYMTLKKRLREIEEEKSCITQ